MGDLNSTAASSCVKSTSASRPFLNSRPVGCHWHHRVGTRFASFFRVAELGPSRSSRLRHFLWRRSCGSRPRPFRQNLISVRISASGKSFSARNAKMSLRNGVAFMALKHPQMPSGLKPRPRQKHITIFARAGAAGFASHSSAMSQT